MPKIQPSIGGKLLMFSSNGNIVETGINIVDLITIHNIYGYTIPKLQGAIGGKLVISTSDSNIMESYYMMYTIFAYCIHHISKHFIDLRNFHRLVSKQNLSLKTYR